MLYLLEALVYLLEAMASPAIGKNAGFYYEKGKKKVLSPSCDAFWVPGRINHCNVIRAQHDAFLGSEGERGAPGALLSKDAVPLPGRGAGAPRMLCGRRRDAAAPAPAAATPSCS